MLKVTQQQSHFRVMKQRDNEELMGSCVVDELDAADFHTHLQYHDTVQMCDAEKKY